MDPMYKQLTIIQRNEIYAHIDAEAFLCDGTEQVVACIQFEIRSSGFQSHLCCQLPIGP